MHKADEIFEQSTIKLLLAIFKNINVTHPGGINYETPIIQTHVCCVSGIRGYTACKLMIDHVDISLEPLSSSIPLMISLTPFQN